MREIPYSSDFAAQKALALAGGRITIKPNGNPVFQFKSGQQYERFVELKNNQVKGA
ncbi:hypothetical protein LC040_12300 [Bacillus tianshenii]|nr:hypothetical protein LC040_12300 [Bacillus tianshenii]